MKMRILKSRGEMKFFPKEGRYLSICEKSGKVTNLEWITKKSSEILVDRKSNFVWKR